MPFVQFCGLVGAMCKFPAATSSDTDEEEFHQHIFNVFLHIVTSYRLCERLEEYLTGEEIGRVGLSCHFALDCLCDSLF